MCQDSTVDILGRVKRMSFFVPKQICEGSIINIS